MFLGIDIGNTTTMLGIYRDEENAPFKTCRYRTDKRGNIADLADSISKSLKGLGYFDEIAAEITGVCFSSVVPEVNSLYHKAIRKLFNLEVLEILHGLIFSVGIN